MNYRGQRVTDGLLLAKGIERVGQARDRSCGDDSEGMGDSQDLCITVSRCKMLVARGSGGRKRKV